MKPQRSIIVAMAILISSQADAARLTQQNEQGPVANCQASLPSFEGALRKRPLGIINEGATTAFLSCGFVTELLDSGVSTVFVRFINRGVNARQASCTLIDGRAPPVAATPPIFFPKSRVSPAGQVAGLAWSQVADNGGVAFKTPNLTCELPPGVELSLSATVYGLDVGL